MSGLFHMPSLNQSMWPDPNQVNAWKSSKPQHSAEMLNSWLGIRFFLLFKDVMFMERQVKDEISALLLQTLCKEETTSKWSRQDIRLPETRQNKLTKGFWKSASYMVENTMAVGKLHAHNLFLNENRAYFGPKMYPYLPRLLPSIEVRRYKGRHPYLEGIFNNSSRVTQLLLLLNCCICAHLPVSRFWT